MLGLGGVVHTIDKVLEVPIGAIQTITVDNMTYFLALGGEAGFLSSESQVFINTFFSRPDVTYFIANSAKAVANTNVSALNESMILQYTNYMAAPRVIYSDRLVDGTRITSVLGVPLLVTVIDGDTYINDAKVTSVDNFVSNGVIHVIDE